MAEAEVLGVIRRILTEELEWTGPVEPHQALLEDLQLDSMGLTVLAVELENAFRVRLSEGDAAQVRTVADLASLVARRVRDEAP